MILDALDRAVILAVAALLGAMGLLILRGDRVGIAISGTYPADGSAPAATTSIRMTFAERMNNAEAQARFALEPPADGRIRWEDRTLIFTPYQPLTAGTRYTARVREGAPSAGGRRTTEPFDWSFTPRAPRLAYMLLDSAHENILSAAPPGGGTPAAYDAGAAIFTYAPSADGEQIALALLNAERNSDLWLMNADGSAPRGLLKCAPGGCTAPAWAPDGRTLAFERREVSVTDQLGPSRVWLVDTLTAKAAPLYQDDQQLGFSPVWSPDGKRIAFYDPEARGIRVLERATGKSLVIPTLLGEVGSFSPDGALMVYADARQADERGTTELWVAILEGEGQFAPLLSPSADDRSPVWSPDGQWIAFSRRGLSPDEGFDNQLMLYNPTTYELRLLAEEEETLHSEFRWDPFSRQIAFNRLSLTIPFAEAEVWVVDIESRQQRRIAVNALNAQWLP